MDEMLVVATVMPGWKWQRNIS